MFSRNLLLDTLMTSLSIVPVSRAVVILMRLCLFCMCSLYFLIRGVDTAYNTAKVRSPYLACVNTGYAQGSLFACCSVMRDCISTRSVYFVAEVTCRTPLIAGLVPCVTTVQYSTSTLLHFTLLYSTVQ